MLRRQPHRSVARDRQVAEIRWRGRNLDPRRSWLAAVSLWKHPHRPNRGAESEGIILDYLRLLNGRLGDGYNFFHLWSLRRLLFSGLLLSFALVLNIVPLPAHFALPRPATAAKD